MEEGASLPYSEHLATSALQSILEQTFQELKTRRLNHIIAHEMPADYLKYIGNVSMLLHSHREPTNNNARMLQKTITEPAEANSHQIHHPPLSRRLQPISQFFQEEQALHLPPPTLQTRKQSVCLSHRSRVSVQRLPSRKIIHSRRKILDANRLILLTRASECQDRNEVYQQKITQLRKRKVKLQEAMRAFREDDRPQRLQFKKSKENQALFTTDFKGKLINFNPKSTKTKPNQAIPFTFKFQTLVESGRSWANWGKVSSTTRRNLFRQTAAPQRSSSEADLS